MHEDQLRLHTNPAPSQEALQSMERQLAAAVRRTCPAWLANQAEDLVQAAMLKVLELSGKGERSRPFGSSYLWRVGYCAVIDEIRRHRRRREVALADQEVLPELRSPQPDPEHRAEGRLLGLAIRDCLQALVAARRQAVTLSLLGHPVREIASLLEWKYKRAENLVSRGLANLRRCLVGKGLKP